LIAACIVLFVGCDSSSDPDDASVDADVGPPGAVEVGGDSAAGLVAGPVARWGSGRANLARYDPVGKRTAVVTTVEISLHGDDGTVARVGGDLVERPGPTALSTDGRLLAVTGESSGTVSVFDLATGQAIGGPFTADGPIARLAFAPDDAALLVSTVGSVTRVPFDGSGPSVLLNASQGALGPAAFAPDGSWIVAPIAGEGPRVALWRSEGVSIVDIPFAEGVNASNAVASPSGTHVGVVTDARDDPFQARLVLWDVAQAALTGSIELGGSGAASPWAFGPDDRVLVADGSATTLWSTSGEQLPTVAADAVVPVQSIFGIGDDQGYLTVRQDGTIDVSDRDGGRLTTIGEPGTTLVDVAPAPGSGTVTTVDFFGTVRRWDITGGGSSPAAAPPTVVVDGVGVVNSVAFAPDGTSVAVATSTGRVETLDEAGDVIRSFEQPVGNVDSVAFSPDSTVVASAMGERRGPESFDDTVTIFDAGSGEASAQFGGEAEQVAGCAFFRNEVRFAPDGELLAANSHDFTVSLYDVSDGSIVHTFPAHASTVTDLAFSPDGDLLATTSDDSTLRIWSVADRQLVSDHVTPAGGYWSLVFGADGRSLVVSDLVGTVSVLDLETGSVVRTFAGQKDRSAELAISPDGSLVASGADDNTVEVWSTASGELIAQLAGHTSQVRTVAFSPDGTLLASGSSDATVRMWSLQGSS
jgi:WD40 repeat protein